MKFNVTWYFHNTIQLSAIWFSLIQKWYYRMNSLIYVPCMHLSLSLSLFPMPELAPFRRRQRNSWQTQGIYFRIPQREGFGIYKIPHAVSRWIGELCHCRAHWKCWCPFWWCFLAAACTTFVRRDSPTSEKHFSKVVPLGLVIWYPTVFPLENQVGWPLVLYFPPFFFLDFALLAVLRLNKRFSWGWFFGDGGMVGTSTSENQPNSGK